ncbi:hypothetical protein JTB14_010966 [Gonioctena quinquepunctata]|nr:hypothetical protein JTB14_010966 [Gonioctena quinquepunctata]
MEGGEGPHKEPSRTKEENTLGNTRQYRHSTPSKLEQGGESLQSGKQAVKQYGIARYFVIKFSVVWLDLTNRFISLKKKNCIMKCFDIVGVTLYEYIIILSEEDF